MISMWYNTGQTRQRCQAFIASLLACLVLVLDGLAVSPHAHECLHHDASSRHHQCAVTIFEQGHVEAFDVGVTCAPQVRIPIFAPLAIFFDFAPAVESLPAGRAPPFSPSKS